MKSGKARVLVVEDDNLFLWTLIHFLEKEGYEVVSAASGEKGYEIAQKGVFRYRDIRFSSSRPQWERAHQENQVHSTHH